MPSDFALFLTPVITWDHGITLSLSQFSGNRPALDRFIYNLADSALLKGGVFMAFLWWQWFRRDNDTMQRRETILTGLAGAVIAIGVARILQIMLPFRARPLHNDVLATVPPVGVNPATLDGWSSFPSDHAVLFFALAFAVWRLHRPLGLLAGCWSVLFICLPRVYLGYHYTSDILVGAAVGSFIMMLVFMVLRPQWLARPLLRWESAHATSFYCLAFLATLELAVLFQDVRQLASDGLALAQQITVIDAAATETPERGTR